jgi:hypothetical protein
MGRVTRWGEFSPFGQLFSSSCFSKITEVARTFGPLFEAVKLMYNINKEWVGMHFGRFFQILIRSPWWWRSLRFFFEGRGRVIHLFTLMKHDRRCSAEAKFGEKIAFYCRRTICCHSWSRIERRRAGIRVARFFLVHDTKTGKMYQMNTKCTKWSKNIPTVCKIFQMAIKCINIFQSRALQNLPKLGFWARKETIWQPWWGSPHRVTCDRCYDF